MLSEAEAKRLRVEVHAAMVAGLYDLARAQLQKRAQRSRRSWSGSSSTLPVAAPPRASRWQRWAWWWR
jgi:hypothetical protein